MTFMPPERLVPSVFGMKDSPPTREGDIYAAGLVIFQVLTGEIPFRTVRHTELGWSVVHGNRPARPENAQSIGFTDSLWAFVQRCWDRDMGSRPTVADVVTQIYEEARNWNRPMAPSIVVENVPSDSNGPLSNSMQHFGLFQSTPASPTESRTSCGLFSSPGSPSTVFTEQSREELPALVAKPLPMGPLVDLQGTLRRRSEEPSEEAVAFPHLTEDHLPPPSNLPQKKRRGFKHFKSKLRGFFGLG